jgi:predicted Rossmann-fold nucleotide-binding protein
LEEMAEILTWAQLDLHHKPCGLLNVRGYFDQLLGFLDHMAAEHFLHAEHRGMLLSSVDPIQLLDMFEAYQPPKADKIAWALQNGLRTSRIETAR